MAAVDTLEATNSTTYLDNLTIDIDDEADVVDWLNESLGDGQDGVMPLPILDQRLARLLAKLDAACADTRANVDRSITEIATSVPRLSFDLQLMREHALMLRFTLDGIRKHSTLTAVSDPETNSVMANLAVLDTIKTRMEAARDVVREAEAWSTLDAEVGPYIAEHAYSRAADRLAEAARSIAVFSNTPEYEGRRSLMVSLQNSLEASLSASLVQATAARDITKCKSYFQLFAQIEREQEFRNYYFSERRTEIVDFWKAADLQDAGTQTGATLYADFLEIFFQKLARMLDDERSYVLAIFPDPLSTQSAFLTTTLDALVPSLHQRLSELVEYYRPSHNILPQLIKVYQLTCDFANRVDRIMSTLHDPVVAVKTAPTHAKHAKHASERFSRHISRQSMAMITSTTEPRPWEVALLEPLLDWQCEYGSLESARLSAALSQITATLPAAQDWLRDEKTDADKNVRRFVDQIQTAFVRSEEALDRCVGLTHGFGAAAYVQAVDAFVSALMEAQIVSIQTAFQQPTIKPTSSDEYLEILEYTANDWAVIEASLKLLALCQQLFTRLAAFEKTLTGRLKKIGEDIGEPGRKEPSTAGLNPGAIELLRQSPLYSAELQSLLANLDKRHLERTRLSAIEFTKTSQALLHGRILGPLIASLANYAQLADWAAATNTRGQVKGAFSLSMPTFSVSPTDYATRFGEGLFNLPRLFEVYAEDDALAFSLETLPHSLLSLDEASVDAETVVHTWLHSLTASALAHLTGKVLPSIVTLSASGASQLSADLSHISNVAKAYDVENETLERWRECTEMSDAEGRKAALDNSDDIVFLQVARIRHWN